MRHCRSRPRRRVVWCAPAGRERRGRRATAGGSPRAALGPVALESSSANPASSQRSPDLSTGADCNSARRGGGASAMVKAGDLVVGQKVDRAAGAPSAPEVTVVMATWSRAAGGRLEPALTASSRRPSRNGSSSSSTTARRMERKRSCASSSGATAASSTSVTSATAGCRACGQRGHRVARGGGGVSVRRRTRGRWRPRIMVAAGQRSRRGGQSSARRGCAPRRHGQVLPAAPVDMLTLSFRKPHRQQAVMVPRELFARHGLYDPNGWRCVATDWDLWLRLARFVLSSAVDVMGVGVSVLADEAAVGALFRSTCRSSASAGDPAQSAAAAGRWRDYGVDATSIAGVRGLRTAARGLDERTAAVSPAAGGVSRELVAEAAAAPASLASASDAAAVAGDEGLVLPRSRCVPPHYDTRARARTGLPKMYYRPLLELRSDMGGGERAAADGAQRRSSPACECCARQWRRACRRLLPRRRPC